MGSLSGIIGQLERQKSAIDWALAALRGLDTDALMTGINGRSESQKKRWAERKKAGPIPIRLARKGGMTP
jgi:hypothetical protein